MSGLWDEAELAWTAWTAGLAYALGTLGRPGRHDALFIYPEPVEPDAFSLAGGSVRIQHWHDVTVAIGHFPRAAEGERRVSCAVRVGAEGPAAETITGWVRERLGCVHPSFVRFGGVEVGADADLWIRTIRLRLVDEAICRAQRRQPPERWDRHPSNQLSLFAPSELDPTTPMLFD